MKVAEVMTRPVITVRAETGVKEAARLLVELGISALPVVDPYEVLVGIVSEADLLPLETWPDPRSQATPLAPTAGRSPKTVAEVMTRDVLTVSAGSEISQAARMMLDNGIKSIPVVQGRRVVGIVSRRDVVRIIARRDKDVEDEVGLRLRELGLGIARDAVNVAAGIATIRIDADGSRRGLVESVALTVPGVLEVRLAAAETPRGR
jgi:CBS-domain-containing membrane protein